MHFEVFHELSGILKTVRLRLTGWKLVQRVRRLRLFVTPSPHRHALLGLQRRPCDTFSSPATLLCQQADRLAGDHLGITVQYTQPLRH